MLCRSRGLPVRIPPGIIFELQNFLLCFKTEKLWSFNNKLQIIFLSIPQDKLFFFFFMFIANCIDQMAKFVMRWIDMMELPVSILDQCKFKFYLFLC